jgi:hypothetical protein
MKIQWNKIQAKINKLNGCDCSENSNVKQRTGVDR